ncbi:cyclic nucleotide-binding domain-containing protein [Lyngbya aestuarii]|uniref:cyclic nucleotide-binding domain-containing protein n=1 Tax=Lyngbya aestuarii TaxID=118322 RepID=UPI00403D86B4
MTTKRNLVAGQRLFHQGDLARAIFVVETGRLKIVRYTSNSRLVSFGVARAGESIAETALLDEVYGCTAIAEVASEVIAYPKSSLLSTLQDNPELTEKFLMMLGKKIKSLKIYLELREIQVADQRLLKYLHYFTQSNNSQMVNFDRPLKEIAAELGFTPETLSRALTRLEQEGTIARCKGVITLHDSSPA